jgi:acetyl esterase/lipase
MLKKFAITYLICATTILAAVNAEAQLSEASSRMVQVGTEYRTVANLTFLTANNYEAKLDVYVPRNVTAPNKTLIMIHGGGWVGGNKEGALLAILPYLEWGWSVVNVEYRLGRHGLAPAAVEDCRCALRWVVANAKNYNFDTGKMVITGHSAGGHLSLTTGMLPTSAGLDRICYAGKEDIKVAAIVNWYGITDVVDILDGENMKGYAVQWMGSQANRNEIGKWVSPLTYVRKDLPPIITIHGDADPTVPYSHAVRLHEALNKVGTVNQLITIPKGGHGGFSREENLRAYTAIKEFLAKLGL